MTSVTGAKQERDAMPREASNAFAQTKVLQRDEIIMIKNRGALSAMLIEILKSTKILQSEKAGIKFHARAEVTV